VLQATRAASPSTQVVIITGYASLDSAITAVRLGGYDYLTKPFSPGQIDVVMSRVEDRVALEEENRSPLRRIGTRKAERAHAAHDRLGAIQARLASMALSLRDLVSEPTRRRQ
jgi:ActR/RegA family two-component response regulator